MDPSAGGSSTSRRRPSPASPLSDKASPPSASRGDAPAGLGRRALKALAARHGIRPTKALGQHFLADPNLARRIASLSGADTGVRILEIGAGLGSLTVALADNGVDVLAIELDRSLLPALEEVVRERPNVTVMAADAMRIAWPDVLGDGRWRMASNLPYNVAVPIVMDLLANGPGIEDFLVMVQREVGERLVAGPGDPAYGAVSVRVTYRAEARLLRPVPASVFWPEPQVESVLVRITPREPPVKTAPAQLFRVVDEGFAQRRKTMANALIRLGLSRNQAGAVLAGCGIDPRVRAESLSIHQFACIADAID